MRRWQNCHHLFLHELKEILVAGPSPVVAAPRVLGSGLSSESRCLGTGGASVGTEACPSARRPVALLEGTLLAQWLTQNRCPGAARKTREVMDHGRDVHGHGRRVSRAATPLL